MKSLRGNLYRVHCAHQAMYLLIVHNAECSGSAEAINLSYVTVKSVISAEQYV